MLIVCSGEYFTEKWEEYFQNFAQAVSRTLIKYFPHSSRHRYLFRTVESLANLKNLIDYMFTLVYEWNCVKKGL